MKIPGNFPRLTAEPRRPRRTRVQKVRFQVRLASVLGRFDVAAVATVVDDMGMRSRRWLIVGVGGVVTAGLVVAAVVFGLQGVEVASWLAGAASFVVAVAALVLAPSGNRAAAPTPTAVATPPPAAGPGAVTVQGDVTGIVSTGDTTTNIQHR